MEQRSVRGAALLVRGTAFSLPSPLLHRRPPAAYLSPSTQKPRRARRTTRAATCCAALSPPTPDTVNSAVADVQRLYGELDDEYEEYHRWAKAQEDIAASGLRERMHASELTYGEFDLPLLGAALRVALARLPPRDGARLFVDIGSGYGRAVHAAARMLGPRWACAGLEIVPGMHAYATAVHAEALAAAADGEERCWATRVRFHPGDYSEPRSAAEDALRDADVCFCFATTWPSGGTPYLTTLSAVLAQRLRHGAIAMTADKQLVTGEALDADGSRFEFVDEIDGPNRCVGDSTVYIYRFLAGNV